MSSKHKFISELRSIWDDIDFSKHPVVQPTNHNGTGNSNRITTETQLEAQQHEATPVISQTRFRADSESYHSYGIEEYRRTGPSQRKESIVGQHQAFTPMLSNQNIGGYS